jgi:hypothetical protein
MPTPMAAASPPRSAGTTTYAAAMGSPQLKKAPGSHSAFSSEITASIPMTNSGRHLTGLTDGRRNCALKPPCLRVLAVVVPGPRNKAFVREDRRRSYDRGRPRCFSTSKTMSSTRVEKMKTAPAVTGGHSSPPVGATLSLCRCVTSCVPTLGPRPDRHGSYL